MRGKQHKYWLGLNLINGIGSSRLRGVYTYFKQDLQAAWHAIPHDLQQAGLDESTIEDLLTKRRRFNLDKAMGRLDELGACICTIEDPEYPALLREIHDAPPMFYYKGQLSPADDRALAIVGTRRATNYGRQVTHDLASDLARAGVTIISGLALGIDGEAHKAALEAGGRTIAVLGNGIDSVYPPEHHNLADAIVSSGQGAIITEYPPRTAPDGRHFPARNRIISGLALGVLIVEAPENSGALLTAGQAAEQGREVFAVPGNITLINSQGPNRLIQDGAKLVLDTADILDELDLSHQLVQTRQTVQSLAPTDDLEDELLALIEREALHVDEIAIQSDLSVHEISAKMTLMVLKGLVQEIAPLTYIRKAN